MAGIYIHIPFCKSKCNYCNFYSVGTLKNKDTFLNALLKETEIQQTYAAKDKINTIYLGGGTPSLLIADEINMLFERIYKFYNVSTDAEITLEVNPDDTYAERVKALRQTPVNRVSIGIQSFFDDDLQYLSRRHNASQARNSIKLLKEAGYENLSADFIYGIPTLTETKLRQNIEEAIGYGIPHISAYSLTVEQGTALDKLIKNKKVKAPDEEQAAEHFMLVTELLKKNNYMHYEISNYCKEGYISRHNSSYWKGEKYLGLGPSAHSFNLTSRQWNVLNVLEYIKSIEADIIPAQTEILSPELKYNEYIMTSLRTMWGCDINYIKQHFDNNIFNHLKKESETQKENGMIYEKDNRLYLTDKGKLFADKIASDLFFVSTI